MSEHRSFRLVAIITLVLSAGSAFLYFDRRIDFSQRDTFIGYFRQGSILFLLAVTWLVFYRAASASDSSPEERTATLQLRYWIGGFVSVVLCSVGLVMAANPYGRLPFHKFPTITLGTRDSKTRELLSYPQAPEVIIMGSSRAFTISPEYIHQKLGLTAFNWSVDAGASEDFLTQAAMLDSAEWSKSPRLLLVEITPPLIQGDGRLATYAPLAMLPYMRWQTAVRALERNAGDLMTITSLSDAIYLMMMRSAGRESDEHWRFGPDGSGTQDREGLSSAALEHEIAVRHGMSYCAQLDPGGQGNIEDLIKIAKDWDAAIIFYESPRHEEFYRVMQNDPRFQACHSIFASYFESLEANNPSVYYLDLSRLESLTQMGTVAFYDSQHLTPLGSEKLVDALSSTMEDAVHSVESP